LAIDYARVFEREFSVIAREAACAGIGFHLLSYYVEDSGHDASVSLECRGEGRYRVVVLDSDPRGCDEDSIVHAVNALPGILSSRLLDVEVDCSYASDSVGHRYSLHNIPIVIMRRVLDKESFLREIAYGARELFFLIGWNGQIAYGLGGENSVIIPLVSGPLFIHTHPSENCYPSYQDVRSMSEFFASGGLVEMIVSRRCTSIARLVEPFLEEDYWALQEISNCMRKRQRDYYGYYSCIEKMKKLKSVVFEVV